jgi:predicted metal-dependent phosphoesterase TrpH
MIKVELHAHTADDPADLIPHSTRDLIDHAARLGFGAVAVTLHDRQLDLRPFEDFARDRGVVVIPGIERTIQGKHVLLLNFPAVAEQLQSFNDLARLKRHYPAGLVIAPHAFYPGASCLRRPLMDRHADLFDAVEINYFHVAGIDFNAPARRWAARHGKPLVGNSDLHRLHQLGRTYSLVDAPADVEGICEAVRAGRVEVRTAPITMGDAAAYFADLWISQVRKTVRQLRPETEPAAA